VSLTAEQVRGPHSGSREWCWLGRRSVQSASRLAAVMFPVPGMMLALGSSASGWNSPMSEKPSGTDPQPPARRQGLNSGLSERSCWGHLPVRPASVSKTVEPQASGRLFDRSRGPGSLSVGRVPWWCPGSWVSSQWGHLPQPSPGLKPLMSLVVKRQFWSGLSFVGPMRRTCSGSTKLEWRSPEPGRQLGSDLMWAGPIWRHCPDLPWICWRSPASSRCRVGLPCYLPYSP
jgi:hypothetical protein